MKIAVHVKANARKEKVEKLGDAEFSVWVKAQAKEGRANLAVIEALSAYLSIPKSRITILRGHAAKHKLIEAAI